ncbi:MAG: indole-3-glycerol phosphate synthase TrpC [Actinobacteria bacterium]|uniref:indole-3-glycerol-phosphate synthase n=1 Tax=freshwater metagenome TaxID=449393 RepID=A0A6J6E1X0_9ZZZZ|nr:indole-3-glycerol phosphate synthase TrpC [Actinomycetota bacterium]MTA32904.1 indole-3-glycerol phosphate synthase TrpC [Actinomycetota bacterium]
MLAELYRGATEDQAARELLVPMETLEELAAQASPPRDALAALAPREGVHIIAEIKRRSPSKGALADIPEPVGLATAYQDGGASAISVLTEGRKFGGSLEDLQAVSGAVDIPVLRKDFISTPYQIIEARASGADWVLLIMAGLDDSSIRHLLRVAQEWGMSALVETHSRDEVLRAIDCGAEIIGVNARDLTTFELDIELFGRLVSLIPGGVVRVAESAVADSQDVARYREQGAHAVLIGEALVTGVDPAQRVREFVNA